MYCVCRHYVSCLLVCLSVCPCVLACMRVSWTLPPCISALFIHVWMSWTLSIRWIFTELTALMHFRDEYFRFWDQMVKVYSLCGIKYAGNITLWEEAYITVIDVSRLSSEFLLQIMCCHESNIFLLFCWCFHFIEWFLSHLTQPPMRRMRIYVLQMFFLFFFRPSQKIPDNRSRERLNGFSWNSYQTIAGKM